MSGYGPYEDQSFLPETAAPGSGAAAPATPQAPWTTDRWREREGRWEWDRYVIFGPPDTSRTRFDVYCHRSKMPGADLPEHEQWPHLHTADTLVEAQVVAERNEVAIIHHRRYELSVEDKQLREKLSMLKGREVE